jgi:hypothetical protein
MIYNSQAHPLPRVIATNFCRARFRDLAPLWRASSVITVASYPLATHFGAEFVEYAIALL